MTLRPSNQIFARGRLDQPQDAAAGGRLAAAGFADQAQRLAGGDLEADIVDRVHLLDLAPKSTPPLTGKFFTRSLTRSSGSVMAAPRRINDRMQATLWPASIVRSSGTALVQAADGERAARRKAAARRRVDQARHHAGDRLEPRASCPLSCRCAGSSGSGPACRDGSGLANSSSTGASSTTRPAYITTTRCAVSATTPIAWVISIIGHAEPRLHLPQQVEDLRLDGDVERGGRLVGDQQLRVADSAIAIMTRWRMPPENWCG